MDTLPAVPPLSIVERAKLENLELRVDSAIKSSIDGALALREIRDLQLFRETHADFSAYVAERFAGSRQQAYRLIDYADVLDNLSPNGDTMPLESHARELNKLPAEEQGEAWAEAVAESDGEPTAADVRDVVDRRKGNAKRVNEPKEFDWCRHFDDAVTNAEEAINNTTDPDLLDKGATRLHMLAEMAELKARSESGLRMTGR